MQFMAIDHIAVNVEDVDRSLAFYHEALGLDIERLDDFRAGKCGFPSARVTRHTVIDLMPGGALARDGRQPLNHFALTLTADDLASLRDRLLEHEVEIVEEAKPRWGAQGNEPSMKVLDPDGNIVELKAPPTPARPSALLATTITLGFAGLTAREGSCCPLPVASVFALTLVDQVGRSRLRLRSGLTPPWPQVTGAGVAASCAIHSVA